MGLSGCESRRREAARSRFSKSRSRAERLGLRPFVSDTSVSPSTLPKAERASTRRLIIFLGKCVNQEDTLGVRALAFSRRTT